MRHPTCVSGLDTVPQTGEMAKQLDLLPALDLAQVERLLTEPSADNRAASAREVGGLLDSGSLSESEKNLALEIVTVLARDVCEQVRRAVCESMKHSPLLPPEVARQLADDVDAIAVPLLMVTEVLNESDLIELVRNGNLAKQLAIAQRPQVGEPLSDALVDTESAEVVATLLENPGAQLPEGAYHKIVDVLHSDPRVQQAIVRRAFLPLTVIHRLTRVVASELREQMVDRLSLPPELVESFVQQGWESALTKIAHGERRIEEVERLVDMLQREGALGATLVLRALLEGDLHFFEAALARLAAVSLCNTRSLLSHGGHNGLRGLYRKSNLPASLYQAFEIAVEETYGYRDEISRGEAPIRQQDLTKRIINRLVIGYREIFPAELETILAQLSRYLQADASA